MVNDTDARTILKPERIAYWMGVGTQPSDRVRTLFKKYGATARTCAANGCSRAAGHAAIVPDAGEPVYVPPAEAAAPAETAEAPASRRRKSRRLPRSNVRRSYVSLLAVGEAGCERMSCGSMC